jgi:hypothetical protein
MSRYNGGHLKRVAPIVLNMIAVMAKVNRVVMIARLMTVIHAGMMMMNNTLKIYIEEGVWVEYYQTPNEIVITRVSSRRFRPTRPDSRIFLTNRVIYSLEDLLKMIHAGTLPHRAKEITAEQREGVISRLGWKSYEYIRVETGLSLYQIRKIAREWRESMLTKEGGDTYENGLY